MNSLIFLFIAIFTLIVGFWGCATYSQSSYSCCELGKKVVYLICFTLFVLGIGVEVYTNISHIIDKSLLMMMYSIQSLIHFLHFVHYFKGLGITSGNPQVRTIMFKGMSSCFILLLISFIPLIQSIFFY